MIQTKVITYQNQGVLMKNLSENDFLAENIKQMKRTNCDVELDEKSDDTQIKNEGINNGVVNNIDNKALITELTYIDESEKMIIEDVEMIRDDERSKFIDSVNEFANEKLNSGILNITCNLNKVDNEIDRAKKEKFIDGDKMNISNKITQKSTGCKKSKRYSSNKDNKSKITKNIVSDSKGKNSKKRYFSFVKVPERFKNLYKKLNESDDNHFFNNKRKKIIDDINTFIKSENDKINKIINKIKAFLNPKEYKILYELKKKLELKQTKLEDYIKPLIRKFKKDIKKKRRYRKRRDVKRRNEKKRYRKIRRLRKIFTNKDKVLFWDLFLGNKKIKYSEEEQKFIKKHLNFQKYSHKIMRYLFKRKDVNDYYQEFKELKIENNKLKNKNMAISLNILRTSLDKLYCKSCIVIILDDKDDIKTA